MPVVNPTAETHPERYGYRLPTMPRIGSAQAERLYAIEERRNEAIQQSAGELGKVLGLRSLWTEALPEALAAILDHYDTHAADAAAIAYLRKRGYEITDKTEGH